MSVRRMRYDIKPGTKVKVSKMEPNRAKLRVKAMGEKIFPSTRWNVKMGKNARIMMTLEKRMGRPISMAVFFKLVIRHEYVP